MFPLAAGGKSPIYWDIRNIQWYPELRHRGSLLMAKSIRDSGIKYDFVVPVLMGALGLGFQVAEILQAPVLTLRDKINENRPSQLEYVGLPKPGTTGLVIEDVLTTGESTEKTLKKLKNLKDKEGNPLNLRTIAVAGLINREQGADAKFAASGIKLICAFKQSDIIEAVLGNNPRRYMVQKYLEKINAYGQSDQ